MAIVLTENFTVDAGVEDTWLFLTDPERVVTCIPSARVLRRVDERSFEGEIGFTLGPFGATLRGEIEFDRLEREDRHIRMTGEAEDVRRDARAHMVLESQLSRTDGAGTRIEVREVVELSGSLSKLAESAIARNVADMLFGRFVGCVRNKLSA